MAEEIDISEVPGLDEAREFLRMLRSESGGAICFVQPMNLAPDPFVFGMAMVDAMKHAARAWSQVVNISEEEALARVYEGFDAERTDATTDIRQVPTGSVN